MLAAILDSGDDAAIAAVVFVITETVRQNSLKDEKPVKNISQI